MLLHLQIDLLEELIRFGLHVRQSLSICLLLLLLLLLRAVWHTNIAVVIDKLGQLLLLCLHVLHLLNDALPQLIIVALSANFFFL